MQHELVVGKRCYRPDYTHDTGVYECPVCGFQMYGDPMGAIHKEGEPCEKSGYTDCIFIFGPEMVKKAIELAPKYGENYAWYRVSVSMLREHFPEVLEEFGYK